MKVLCVLYDDPKGGMPKSYPLSDLPKLEKYPDGMTLPSPKGREFTLTAALVCFPVFSNTEEIKSEAPLITRGCLIKSSVELT